MKKSNLECQFANKQNDKQNTITSEEEWKDKHVIFRLLKLCVYRLSVKWTNIFIVNESYFAVHVE